MSPHGEELGSFFTVFQSAQARGSELSRWVCVCSDYYNLIMSSCCCCWEGVEVGVGGRMGPSYKDIDWYWLTGACIISHTMSYNHGSVSSEPPNGTYALKLQPTMRPPHLLLIKCFNKCVCVCVFSVYGALLKLDFSCQWGAAKMKSRSHLPENFQYGTCNRRSACTAANSHTYLGNSH